MTEQITYTQAQADQINRLHHQAKTVFVEFYTKNMTVDQLEKELIFIGYKQLKVYESDDIEFLTMISETCELIRKDPQNYSHLWNPNSSGCLLVQFELYDEAIIKG